MEKIKRLIIATSGGVIFGFVCYAFAESSPGQLAWPIILQIIFSRTLIGLAIGISCLSLGHWSIHGMTMGMIFSLPLAFSGLMAPANPNFNQALMFFSTIILGMIYGLLIELITSLIFKARMKS